jgi:hypothetical protein
MYLEWVPYSGNPAFEETSEPLVPVQALSRIYGISFRRARAGRAASRIRTEILFFRRVLIRGVPIMASDVDVRLDRYGIDATSEAGEPDHPAPMSSDDHDVIPS